MAWTNGNMPERKSWVCAGAHKPICGQTWCVCVCVWACVCVCFYSDQQDLLLWRMPSCTAEGKMSRKTNELRLLSNKCFSRRKTARCPNHGHIAHVRLAHSTSGLLLTRLPFHQSIFFRSIWQFSFKRHCNPKIPLACFWKSGKVKSKHGISDFRHVAVEIHFVSCSDRLSNPCSSPPYYTLLMCGLQAQCI